MTTKMMLLEEMKNTVRNIRDAKINADTIYPEYTIKNNMMQYFTGLKYAMEIITRKEWHWSNGETGLEWCVVEIDNKGDAKFYKV